MSLRPLVLAWFVAAFAAAPLTPPSAAAPSFQAGEQAYVATDFAAARAAYAAAAGTPSLPAKDRAASLRQLGVIAWRLSANDAEAERYFAAALGVGVDLSRTHAERARFYAGARKFDDAARAADAAMAAAANQSEQDAAALASARAILAKLDGTKVAQQTPADAARLARARDLIVRVGGTPPLPLKLSETLLEVALRLDDGPTALVAWRSYAREGAQQGAWVPAARLLGTALPGWRRGGLTPQRRNDIVQGLRTSAFFDLAVLIADDDRFADRASYLAQPYVADTFGYAQMMTKLQSLTDGYYRDLANRKADATAWQGAVMTAAQELWTRLDFQGVRPPFDLEAFRAELARRFATYASIGQTGEVVDLHYGHIFADDPRAIEQYGRKATIRRVALDRMLSNGYESWVWDGRQAHGGWAGKDRVYLVRPGYADGSLAEWRLLTEPSVRAEREELIARLTVGDDDIARADPAAFLPGLALRLEWQGQNAILDELRAAGVPPGELKGRFIVEHDRVRLDASFYAHEGRHVLDKLAFGKQLSDEELEFRAKLSEVAFSEHARLNFGSILNANMGDPTSPHGRANKRVASGLLAWMEAHRTAIPGLDPARPLFPQFDKLTDDQMREAARSMDPWAPKR